MHRPRCLQDGRASLSLIIVGLSILTFGGLLLVNNLGLADVGHLMRMVWPLGLGILGLAILLRHDSPGRWWGMMWIAVGAWIYAEQRDWINVNVFALFMPVSLLILGGTLLWRAVKGPTPEPAVQTGSEYIRSFAVLSGSDLRPVAHPFQGGNLTVLAGGIKLDLSEATLEQEKVVIDVFALIGGLEIIVPSDWMVVSEMTTVLGGYVDKRRPTTAAATHTLILRGTVAMGGIEIKS